MATVDHQSLLVHSSNEEDDHVVHLDDIDRNSWTNMTRVIGLVTRTLREIKPL